LGSHKEKCNLEGRPLTNPSSSEEEEEEEEEGEEEEEEDIFCFLGGDSLVDGSCAKIPPQVTT